MGKRCSTEMFIVGLFIRGETSHPPVVSYGLSPQLSQAVHWLCSLVGLITVGPAFQRHRAGLSVKHINGAQGPNHSVWEKSVCILEGKSSAEAKQEPDRDILVWVFCFWVFFAFVFVLCCVLKGSCCPEFSPEHHSER